MYFLISTMQSFKHPQKAVSVKDFLSPEEFLKVVLPFKTFFFFPEEVQEINPLGTYTFRNLEGDLLTIQAYELKDPINWVPVLFVKSNNDNVTVPMNIFVVSSEY